MSLSKEQVLNVAHLARLEISADKTELYAQQLSNILGMVDQLAQANTEDVIPMAHPLEMVQRLRPDVVSEENRRETYLANAPSSEQGLFLVPKVIE